MEQFWPDCQEYEDEWGYRHGVDDNGKEITKNHKCIAFWFVTKDEWYYQNERGQWKNGAQEDRIEEEDRINRCVNGHSVEKRNEPLPMGLILSILGSIA